MSEEPAPFPFDDGKAPDAMRTIGEVAAGFGIKQHILRYWEQQFPMLRPLKRSGGRRLYRPEDVALVGRIHGLISRQGYTLKGALQVLEGGGSDKAEAANNLPSMPTESANVVVTLKSIRRRLSEALSAA